VRASLKRALRESLGLLEGGQASLEQCLDRFPEHADRLRPLLETAMAVRRVRHPVSSQTAFEDGWRRMLAALNERRRRRALPSGWITRGRSPALVVATVTALLLLSAGLLALPWLRAPIARTAVLTAANGSVEIRPAGDDAWQPASAGAQVRAGDALRAGPLSSATLTYFDGSLSQLGAETGVTINQMASRRAGGGHVIALGLWAGRTHNVVQPLPDSASRFEIGTLLAIATVRGTEFDVSVEADGTTRVVVSEGVVNVEGVGATVTVVTGQEVIVRSGEAPEQPPNPPTATSTPTRVPEPTATAGQAAEPSPTPAPPTATPSPSPTNTPSPTPTAPPTPTFTPLPPPTATPRPAPTSPPPPPPTSTPVLPPPTPTWSGAPTPRP
jgi:hypothetical protein